MKVEGVLIDHLLNVSRAHKSSITHNIPSAFVLPPPKVGMEHGHISRNGMEELGRRLR